MKSSVSREDVIPQVSDLSDQTHCLYREMLWNRILSWLWMFSLVLGLFLEFSAGPLSWTWRWLGFILFLAGILYFFGLSYWRMQKKLYQVRIGLSQVLLDLKKTSPATCGSMNPQETRARS